MEQDLDYIGRRRPLSSAPMRLGLPLDTSYEPHSHAAGFRVARLLPVTPSHILTSRTGQLSPLTPILYIQIISPANHSEPTRHLITALVRGYDGIMPSDAPHTYDNEAAFNNLAHTTWSHPHSSNNGWWGRGEKFDVDLFI
jgi:hypothetical protein